MNATIERLIRNCLSEKKADLQSSVARSRERIAELRRELAACEKDLHEGEGTIAAIDRWFGRREGSANAG